MIPLFFRWLIHLIIILNNSSLLSDLYNTIEIDCIDSLEYHCKKIPITSCNISFKLHYNYIKHGKINQTQHKELLKNKKSSKYISTRAINLFCISEGCKLQYCAKTRQKVVVKLLWHES